MRRFRTAVMTLCIAVLLLVSVRSDMNRAAEADDAAMQEAAAKYAAAGQISQIRRSLGLTSLSQNADLESAADNHSLYMDTSKSTSFEEIPGENGFTGSYPADRASYSGYPAQYVTEYDNYRMVSYADFITWCLQDPYLRPSLLNPNYSDIGFSRTGYYYCMMLGGDGYHGESMTTVYPYVGQEEVGTVRVSDLTHTPSALEEAGVQTVGIPITVQYYREGISDLRFENIRTELLNTETEQAEDLIVIAPQDHVASIWNALILFPLGAYSPGTRYTVTVAFDVYDRDVYIERIEEKWSFTSIGTDYIGGMTRAEVLEALMKALAAPEGMIQERLAQIRDPEENATREQAIVWTIDLLNECAPEVMETITVDYHETFEDINQCEDEARDKVQMAYQMHLVEDQGRGILNPKAMITRAELGKITTKLEQRFRIQWPLGREESEEEEPPEETPPEEEPAEETDDTSQ